MNNPGLKFLVTTLALTCYISSVAAQNRASVDVRKTDHTLVWPLDFMTVNNKSILATNGFGTNITLWKAGSGPGLKIRTGTSGDLFTVRYTNTFPALDVEILTLTDSYLRLFTGAVYLDGSTNALGGQTYVDNIVYNLPRWTDATASGYSFGAGLSAPDSIKVYPGSSITGKAYAHGDDMNFSVQSSHDLAETNVFFPNFYFEPHIHVSRNTNNAGTNVTFWMELHTAKVWGVFTNAVNISLFRDYF